MTQKVRLPWDWPQGPADLQEQASLLGQHHYNCTGCTGKVGSLGVEESPLECVDTEAQVSLDSKTRADIPVVDIDFGAGTVG